MFGVQSLMLASLLQGHLEVTPCRAIPSLQILLLPPTNAILSPFFHGPQSQLASEGHISHQKIHHHLEERTSPINAHIPSHPKCLYTEKKTYTKLHVLKELHYVWSTRTLPCIPVQQFFSTTPHSASTAERKQRRVHQGAPL